VLDILIKNGTVIDGTGNQEFQADVGVANGRIAIIARHIEQKAVHTIDAQGLYVSPGFIDPHTHSDGSLLINRLAESKIRQGVTTEIIGNCGISVAPVDGEAVAEISGRVAKIELDITWRSMGEYLDHLRKPGMAVNVVALIGHNTIRGSVLGYKNVQPTPEQQARMEQMVDEAMAEGARGLSTGLYYPPGYYADIEEIIGLARVLKKHGGVYTSHIRSESDTVLESIAEAIKIGEKAEVPVEVSHVKIEGYRNFDKIEQLLAMMNDVQTRGLPIGFDQYPYIASGTWLSTALPYWATVGGTQAIVERMKDPDTRAKLHLSWKNERLEWDNRLGVRDWNEVIISDLPNHPELLGKSIADIAQAEGKDELDTLFDLLILSNGLADAIWFSQDEEIAQTLMQHPLVTIGSDGNSLRPDGILGKRKGHPRAYGTFPRVLGHYVREEKIISLEKAVKKMTLMTAERFGLTDRGIIRERAWADLTLFDATTVRDCATFTNPHLYPIGIPYVIVNGQIVINQGQHTGALPGQIL
jgi:N-acyl-D-amino-acid deacylase